MAHFPHHHHTSLRCWFCKVFIFLIVHMALFFLLGTDLPSVSWVSGRRRVSINFHLSLISGSTLPSWISFSLNIISTTKRLPESLWVVSLALRSEAFLLLCLDRSLLITGSQDKEESTLKQRRAAVSSPLLWELKYSSCKEKEVTPPYTALLKSPLKSSRQKREEDRVQGGNLFMSLHFQI